MNLVWKLLRQHISKSQLTGFFVANLAGMFIVLLSVQVLSLIHIWMGYFKEEKDSSYFYYVCFLSGIRCI